MEPNVVTMATQEEDETTCPSVPKSTRIIAYIIQGIIGIFLTIPSVFDSSKSNYGLIIGIILVLSASLWVMKPLALWKKLIDPVRLISFIVLIAAIVLHFLLNIQWLTGWICSGAAFWYFLSFIPGAQEWVKNCLSGCFSTCLKGKDGQNENLV